MIKKMGAISQTSIIKSKSIWFIYELNLFITEIGKVFGFLQFWCRKRCLKTREIMFRKGFWCSMFYVFWIYTCIYWLYTEFSDGKCIAPMLWFLRIAFYLQEFDALFAGVCRLVGSMPRFNFDLSSLRLQVVIDRLQFTQLELHFRRNNLKK